MISSSSPYTIGEATALIAAIVDADIEDIADWAIVAVRRDGGIITITSDEDTSTVIQLLALAIGRIARGEP